MLLLRLHRLSEGDDLCLILDLFVWRQNEMLTVLVLCRFCEVGQDLCLPLGGVASCVMTERSNW